MWYPITRVLGGGEGSGSVLGTVTGRDTVTGNCSISHGSNVCLDAEIVDNSQYGKNSRLVFAGKWSSTQRDAVSGTTTSPDGDQVCNDSAYDGESCDLVIDNNNNCITIDEAPLTPTVRTVCHEVYAVKPSHAIANGEGDSRGPVFRFKGSELFATGIDSAANPSTQIPCKVNVDHWKCFYSLYYTNVNNALPYYHARVRT
jgi:hypothetical protein